MKRTLKIRHEFVEFIPKDREEGVLYVSIPHATAVHSCFCGCGTKTVTPISPVGWQLSYDGESVSLTPSVGNWAFPCRSHYIIRRDTVLWAGDMSGSQIAWGRERDRKAREVHYDGKLPLEKPAAGAVLQHEQKDPVPARKRTFLGWLMGKD